MDVGCLLSLSSGRQTDIWARQDDVIISAHGQPSWLSVTDPISVCLINGSVGSGRPADTSVVRGAL